MYYRIQQSESIASAPLIKLPVKLYFPKPLLSPNIPARSISQNRSEAKHKKKRSTQAVNAHQHTLHNYCCSSELEAYIGALIFVLSLSCCGSITPQTLEASGNSLEAPHILVNTSAHGFDAFSNYRKQWEVFLECIFYKVKQERSLKVHQ